VVAIAQHVVDDAVLAAERQRAHRALGAQHAELFAAAAREDQGQDVAHHASPIARVT
jgi:hypothetical protein